MEWGGGTLFLIKNEHGEFFLKIKHKDVLVESKLEEENDFINESCVAHERRMNELAAKAGVSVPKILFFDEQDGFQFFATDYIEDSLEDTLEKASIEDVLSIWQDLYKNVKLMFEAGLVHSDIHELNIRCQDNKVFLIDMEETREFVQNGVFEESLDFAGTNGKSSLGEFPLADKQDYTVRLNSLNRMRQVFKKELIPKVIEYVKECNYDSSNGICINIDHGSSTETYQSIQNKWLNIKGQREQKDIRPLLVNNLLKSLGIECDYTFLDVGSNNGLFCREVSKANHGSIRAIGLEGFHKFNVLAKSLAFLEDCKNVEYYDFLCGEDALDVLNINNKCFINICSVWHHIQNKSEFIKQLNNLDLIYAFLEMPVQRECYNGKTWEEEVYSIKRSLGFEDYLFLGHSHDYNRPLVLLSKGEITKKEKHKLEGTANRILNPSLLDKFLMHIKS